MKRHSQISGVILFALVVILTGTALVTPAVGKSLYVIGQVVSFDKPTPILAYDIGPDGGLSYQTQLDIPMYGSGTVGLALDAWSESLFVTHEDSDIIQVIDATTMEKVGNVYATGAANLAGIVFDHGKQLLYCADRWTSNLYVYLWDPNSRKLTLAPSSPVTLSGTEAFGIALDEDNDLLYVANASKTVTVYRTDDWSLAREITLHRPAISIAVDITNGMLYTGAGYLSNQYLTQHDLMTDEEDEVLVDEVAGVMGLAVDPDTSLVYLDTGRDQKSGGDDLLVYDLMLKRVGTVLDIGNPTGIAVPWRDVSYNPLKLRKTLAQNGTTGDIIAGKNITYTICFEPDGYSLTNTVIVDTLPQGLTFVSADGNGQYGHYDPNAHTYTWTNPPTTPASGVCLQLVAQVREEVSQGSILRNFATIRSNEIQPTTVRCDAKITGLVYHGLNMTKKVTKVGSQSVTAGQLPYAQAGDLVTYILSFDNKANTQNVSDVAIVDVIPEQMTFVSATGEGVFGHYDAATRAFTWSYPSLEAGLSKSVELVLRVNSSIPPGTRISNWAVIDSRETGETSASVEISTNYNPLNIAKTVVAPAGWGFSPPYIFGPGDLVTYNITIDNANNDKSVTNVTVIDDLPQEVTFVSAEPDGMFGRYDGTTHTYKWTFPTFAAAAQQHIEITVRIKEDVAPGAAVLNTALAGSTETAEVSATAEIFTHLRPLTVSKHIVPTDPNVAAGAVQSIDPGDLVTYSICFDNRVNDQTVHDVTIVDALPDAVSFVSAEGDGVFGTYDASAHAYIWTLDSLAPDYNDCLELTVHVNADASPGATVANSVVISGRETEPNTATAEFAVLQRSLNIAKQIAAVIPAVPVSGDANSVAVGDEIVYEIVFDNNDNDIAATNVSIVDTLPPEVQFIAAEGDGQFGSYDPNAHTYTWVFPTIEAGQSGSVQIAVQVKSNAVTGTLLTNTAVIDANNTSEKSASVEIPVTESPIEGQLDVSPFILGRKGCTASTRLWALVTLPAGINPADVSSAIVLSPGQVQPIRPRVMTRNGRVAVGAYFSAKDLLNAVPQNGLVEITVAGQLKSGRPFAGRTTVRILEVKPL